MKTKEEAGYTEEFAGRFCLNCGYSEKDGERRICLALTAGHGDDDYADVYVANLGHCEQWYEKREG
jgi:hypothetical protein